MTPGTRRSLRAFRLALTAVILLAGLAVASPVRRVSEPAAQPQVEAQPPEQAQPPPQCAQGAPKDLRIIVLPPGHPPVPGLQSLPPGHPPLDGPQPARRAPPLPASPIFQAPTTVDL